MILVGWLNYCFANVQLEQFHEQLHARFLTENFD